MENLLTGLLNQISAHGAPYLYGFLFLSSVLENVFPPIPGDTVTALGAFLVGSGKLSIMMVFISTTLGSTTGFFLLYYIARHFGIEFFEHRRLKWINRVKMDKAKQRITRYGYPIILLNRFFPGVRSVISITAGIVNMKPLPVLALSFVSAAAWNYIWIQMGYTLGSNWQAVKAKVSSVAHTYNIVVGAVLCAALLLFAANMVWKIHKKRTATR